MKTDFDIYLFFASYWEQFMKSMPIKIIFSFITGRSFFKFIVRGFLIQGLKNYEGFQRKIVLD